MSRAGLSIQSLICVVVILAINGTMTALYGQVECPTMSCNKKFQISLDFECDYLLHPDLFLEGDTLSQKNDPNEKFSISISSLDIEDLALSAYGSEMPGWKSEKLFGSHNYSIENDCGNSCWGVVTIESKVAPKIVNEPKSIWSFTCSEVHDVLDSDQYTASWGLNPELSSACDQLHYNMYFKDHFTQLPDCDDKTSGTYYSTISDEISDDFDDDLLLDEAKHFETGLFPLNRLNGVDYSDWRADLHVAPNVADCNLMINVESDLKYAIHGPGGSIEWVEATLQIYTYTMTADGNIIAVPIANTTPAAIDEEAKLLVRASHPDARGSYSLQFSGDCDAILDNNVCVRQWYVAIMDHGIKTEHKIFEQTFSFTSLDLNVVDCAASGFEISCEQSSDPDSLYHYFNETISDSAAIVNAYPHIKTGKRKIGTVKIDSFIWREVPVDTVVQRLYLNDEWVFLPVVTKVITEEVVKVERKAELPVIIPLQEGTHLCNILIARDDVEIAICGKGTNGSHKVIRTWSIVDWCQQTTNECLQIFEVKDTKAPEIKKYRDHLYTSIEPWHCTANVPIPIISAYDNCTHDIGYSITVKDTISQNIVAEREIAPGEMAIFSIEGEQAMMTASGIVPGVYWIYYVAVDDCGNRSDAKRTLLEVVDHVPPVAVCPDELVISLINDEHELDGGVAKVPAAAFDDGSHDSDCNEVYFKVLRMDEWDASPDRRSGLPVACEEADAVTYERDKHGLIIDSTAVVYFDDYVKFCCADDSVTVVLRVFDQDPGDGPIAAEDYVGNYNDCMILVTTKKQLPQLKVCAPARHTDCLDDLHDMSIMGMPEIENGCDVHHMIYQDAEYGDPSCGTGRIIRSWYFDQNHDGIVDLGEPHMCDQEIFMDGQKFDPTSIKWPKHYTGDWVRGIHRTTDESGYCQEKAAQVDLGDAVNCTDEIELCAPEWASVDCGLIGHNVDIDTIYAGNGSSCSKIIKRWTVIDWCHYDPNTYHAGSNHTNELFEAVQDNCDTTGCISFQEYGTYYRYARVKNHEGRDSAAIIWDGYYTWEQVIKVVDETIPVIDPAVTIDADLSGESCQGSITINKHAEDSGCVSLLKWDIQILNYEGELVAQHSANGSDVSWEVDHVGSGEYTVKYVVSDGCQNVATAEDTYIARDSREPTPYCLSGVSTTVMETDGKATIWAADFNIGSYDNCDEAADLRFTLSDIHPDDDPDFIVERGSSAATFSCADLQGASSRTIDLTMYVWDRSGNRDFCSVYFRIDDTDDDCNTINNPPTDDPEGGDDQTDENVEPEVAALISGSLRTSTGSMIEAADITINSALPGYPKVYTSDSGLYAFDENPLSMNYIIRAEKHGDYLNGVSTLDLVLLQQHILGTQNFNDPYKVIAGDVNSDQKLTASDVVLLRRLILGLITELPANSWRFINAENQFADYHRPWPFAEQIVIDALIDHATAQNFIGIKIGDVNGDVTTNQLRQSELRSSSELVQLTMKDIPVTAGQTYDVSVHLQDQSSLFGIQFALDLGYMTVIELTSANIDITADHYHIDDGRLYVSWHAASELSIDGPLLQVVLRAEGSGYLSEQIQLSDLGMAAEVYHGYPTVESALTLSYESKDASFELYQNQPNPFTQSTTVGFRVPSDMSIVFSIIDVSGRVVHSQQSNYDTGYHEIEIASEHLQSKGIFYYRLTGEHHSSTKKMLLIP